MAKVFIHNTVVELTFRVEEGLPLVSTSFMQLIFESFLARAQCMYPVTTVAFVVMANHVHIIVVVEDPAAVCDFVEYLKRETAHAVNHLLERSRHTVWQAGYDSPIILDAEKCVQRLAYFYTNPQRARLENTIEAYPRLNTWSTFLSGEPLTTSIPTFPRWAVPPLSSGDEEDITRAILKEKHGEAKLRIDPFAWLKIYPDTRTVEPQQIVDEVVKQVRYSEQLFRHEKDESVLGAALLCQQDMRKRHQPKKRGKKMTCLGSEKTKRREFIAWVREQAECAKAAIRILDAEGR